MNINKEILESLRDDSHGTAIYNGKKFWSGCASMLDGHIEEVHSYLHAKGSDFHHSIYFSAGAVDRMEEDDSTFFFISEEGKIMVCGWRASINKETGLYIADQISKQIKIL